MKPTGGASRFEWLGDLPLARIETRVLPHSLSLPAKSLGFYGEPSSSYILVLPVFKRAAKLWPVDLFLAHSVLQRKANSVLERQRNLLTISSPP